MIFKFYYISRYLSNYKTKFSFPSHPKCNDDAYNILYYIIWTLVFFTSNSLVKETFFRELDA